jgi:hypothetical protein
VPRPEVVCTSRPFVWRETARAAAALLLAGASPLARAATAAAAPERGTPVAATSTVAAVAADEGWGYTDEQWAAIEAGSIDTEETEANRAAAEEIYGSPGSLSQATDPVAIELTRAAARVDPWLQYVGVSNAPLTVYEFVVAVRNTDGSLEPKRYTGTTIAEQLGQGIGGAAYDFRDNSTKPLTAVANDDGSVTISKEQLELFTHLYYGGQDGGVDGMVMAVCASGDGYMECGIDVKNENFDDFPGQNGNDGSYHTPINGSYQRVTAEPQWFGISNANE